MDAEALGRYNLPDHTDLPGSDMSTGCCTSVEHYGVHVILPTTKLNMRGLIHTGSEYANLLSSNTYTLYNTHRCMISKILTRYRRTFFLDRIEDALCEVVVHVRAVMENHVAVDTPAVARK